MNNNAAPDELFEALTAQEFDPCSERGKRAFTGRTESSEADPETAPPASRNAVRIELLEIPDCRKNPF